MDAAQRISLALLIELLSLADRRFEEHLATLDLEAAGGPVEGATGTDPAPVWLDVATDQQRFISGLSGRAIPDQIFSTHLEHAFELRRFGSVWGSDVAATSVRLGFGHVRLLRFEHDRLF